MLSEDALQNGTIVGADGYLFLASGVHLPLEFMTGKVKISDRSLANFDRNITRRKLFSTKLGARYQHFIAPDKHTVLPGHLPFDNLVSLGAAYVAQGHGDLNFPVAELGEGHNYWKTDTHWTPAGRIVGAKAIARGFGLPEDWIEEVAASVDACLVSTSSTFMGDLGRRFEPARGEPEIVVEPNWPIWRFTNKAGRNDGLCMAFYSQHPKATGRLLVFGDSFMMESLVVLTAFFKEILFCRSRYFHREMAFAAGPDFILTQNVERYLSFVHDDDDAPPFFLMAHAGDKPMHIEPVAAEAIGALASRRSAHYRKFVSSLTGYVPEERDGPA